MKKITENEAIKLIKRGVYPQCQVGRISVPIKSIGDFQRYKDLAQQKVQKFELFLPTNTSVPKGACPLTIEEALLELQAKTSVLIYVLKNGKESFVANRSELMSYCERCNVRGENIVLYKYK